MNRLQSWRRLPVFGVIFLWHAETLSMLICVLWLFSSVWVGYSRGRNASVPRLKWWLVGRWDLHIGWLHPPDLAGVLRDGPVTGEFPRGSDVLDHLPGPLPGVLGVYGQQITNVQDFYNRSSHFYKYCDFYDKNQQFQDVNSFMFGSHNFVNFVIAVIWCTTWCKSQYFIAWWF